MSIDLKSLSARQLQKLISEANREKKRKLKRAPLAAVRKKLTRMAAAEGYTLLELFGVNGGGAAPRAEAPRPGKRSSTAGRKVPPKYRNPGNPEETWSGRGKQPRWMVALVAKGGKPEDFLI